MNQAFVTWVGKGGSLTATGSISGRATAALFRHRPRFRDNVLTMARRSLAHNFQAVWYRAAIMALCWPATPSEVKFAADSPLEEAGFELSVPGEQTAPFREMETTLGGLSRDGRFSREPSVESGFLQRRVTLRVSLKR
jgi:hypothetical protein